MSDYREGVRRPKKEPKGKKGGGTPKDVDPWSETRKSEARMVQARTGAGFIEADSLAQRARQAGIDPDKVDWDQLEGKDLSPAERRRRLDEQIGKAGDLRHMGAQEERAEGEADEAEAEIRRENLEYGKDHDERPSGAILRDMDENAQEQVFRPDDWEEVGKDESDLMGYDDTSTSPEKEEFKDELADRKEIVNEIKGDKTRSREELQLYHEMVRTPRGVARDRSRTHQRVGDLEDPVAQERWMKAPGRMDLNGVDTAGMEMVDIEAHKKTVKAQKKLKKAETPVVSSPAPRHEKKPKGQVGLDGEEKPNAKPLDPERFDKKEAEEKARKKKEEDERNKNRREGQTELGQGRIKTPEEMEKDRIKESMRRYNSGEALRGLLAAGEKLGEPQRGPPNLDPAPVLAALGPSFTSIDYGAEYRRQHPGAREFDGSESFEKAKDSGAIMPVPGTEGHRWVKPNANAFPQPIGPRTREEVEAEQRKREMIAAGTDVSTRSGKDMPTTIDILWARQQKEQRLEELNRKMENGGLDMDEVSEWATLKRELEPKKKRNPRTGIIRPPKEPTEAETKNMKKAEEIALARHSGPVWTREEKPGSMGAEMKDWINSPRLDCKKTPAYFAYKGKMNKYDQAEIDRIMKNNFTEREQEILRRIPIKRLGIKGLGTEGGSFHFITNRDMTHFYHAEMEIRTLAPEVVVHESLHALRIFDTERRGASARTPQQVISRTMEDKDYEEAMTTAETTSREIEYSAKPNGYYTMVADPKRKSLVAVATTREESEKFAKDRERAIKMKLEDREKVGATITTGLRGEEAIENTKEKFPEMNISRLKIKGSAEAVDQYFKIEGKDGKVERVHEYNPNGAAGAPPQGATSEYKDGKPVKLRGRPPSPDRSSELDQQIAEERRQRDSIAEVVKQLAEDDGFADYDDIKREVARKNPTMPTSEFNAAMDRLIDDREIEEVRLGKFKYVG